MQKKRNGSRFPDASWFIRILIILVLSVPFLWTIEKPTTAHAQESLEPLKPTTRIYLPSIQLGRDTTPASSPDWLIYLNSYRAMAYLPPVREEPGWSNGGQSHSRYTVKNDVLMHGEVAGNPWYTAEGLAAAQSGNLMGSYDFNASDRHAIDSWMQAPFHALGILDPALEKVGFGSYREADGGIQMGATLDVLRGLGPVSPSVAYPIMWPGNGATVPLVKFYSESPSPLTSCPGYTSPSGLPITLQIGPGQLSPAVTDYSITQNGTRLESCVFTEGTYTNPDANAQNLGRAILNERDAVVLIPRVPLAPGAAYTVSLTVSGQSYTWSFKVATTTVDLSLALP